MGVVGLTYTHNEPATLNMKSQHSSRRRFVCTLTALLGGQMTLQAFGKTPTVRRIVCPFSPGGMADKLSRVLAQEATQLTGDTWYVQNTPGAGGLIGSNEVALSEPNGQTLLFSPTGVFRTRGGQEDSRSRVDPVRDLEPNIIFGAMPLVCVMRPDQKRSNLRTYLADLRASGAPLMYATSGHGSTSHFMGAYIAKRHQLASVHIPFAGSLPTITAVLGGHVPCAIVDPMLVIEHINSGSLHGLAISSSSREPRLSMIETLLEQNLSAVEFTSWQGLLLPSATPAPIKATTSNLFLSLTKSEPVKKVLHEAFVQSMPMTGARAQTFFQKDHHLFQALMADLQIDIQ